jgi:hypothetical protein
LKYWEIIADNLSKLGWSWSCVSGVDFDGQNNLLVPGESPVYTAASLVSDEIPKQRLRALDGAERRVLGAPCLFINTGPG